jgi:hypothetical protein
MSDDLSAMIGIIVVLFFIALALTPVITIWVLVFYNHSKRKKIRQRILNSRADIIANKRWFPARYASQRRFDSFFKFFPWEGAGIVVVAPGSVLFLGETMSGSPITLQFAPGNSRINWLGKCPWPNGMISWLRFDTAAEKHYFSSETGVMVFGSHAGTKAIYDEANRFFGAPVAQNI